MLLANLAQFEGACTLLAKHEGAVEILEIFGRSAADDERFGQLPAALTQLLTISSGRALVLAKAAAVRALLECLPPGGERRAGAAHALRNLCFEAAADAPARDELLRLLDELIPALVAPLHVACALYDDDELSRLPLRVRAAVNSPPAAVDEPAVRLALTEALVLLSAASEAREAMRRLDIYPVLREAHKAEEAEPVKDANETLVSEVYLKDPPV